MKKPLGILIAILLVLILTGPAASPQSVPAKAVEGPDVRKQETKGTEDTDVRKKKKKITATSGQKAKGTEDTDVRRKKKAPADSPQKTKGTGGSEGRQTDK